ncbi:hypothetical protein EZV62_002989 [Acer yangbiense]|uniref:YqgF/RNase H-like domain-containing protein n=1 Tax=Acer yangbiense TaxID=1000413 RepID=A0A5C7IYU6_9ROSI|nr:hypothetical protein EZV62_002989 [Acer yangbiense]
MEVPENDIILQASTYPYTSLNPISLIFYKNSQPSSDLFEATPSSSLPPPIRDVTFSQMKYLTPVDFYTKIFKDVLMIKDSKHGRLLGLDVYENYVSLAVSDPNNLIAVPLRNLDIQEDNITSRVADIILSLIPEYNLVGIVVGTDYFQYNSTPLDVPTRIFIDNLYKTGKVEGLNHTFWDRGLTSMNAEFVLHQHVQYILENLNQPQDMSRTVIEKCHAVSSLQGYLDGTDIMLEDNWD